ncbi:hypothetical protein [Paracidovorax valerianellae]|uniref:SURF1-like protein n=1 Tax=Paracidovorax valerianellae TaxID=187868 RepID=A0A1G6JWS2_9BURK|nr:hypothetical protein [Paracidovorax valerianellae]MDA8445260.1 hypothetical protein [Paracidovorax valerianellae]SDC22446.1 hypothetical protein SAMN05192589_101487 [Paracidovorax valerianellae]
MAATRHAFTLHIGALARRRFMALMAAMALLMLAAAATAPLPAAAKDSNQKFGKRLVEVYELPSEALAKFAQFQEKKGAANAARPRGEAPDTQPWTGSEIVSLGTSGNPYTLVVRVSGVALADGDAGTMWMAGWSIDGASRTALVPQVAATGLRAGQAVEMVGAAAPLSFKEDRKVQPVLEFANARNVRIDRVRLEVWSGIRPSTFLELFMSWIPMFTGVVFLALVWWWRRR